MPAAAADFRTPITCSRTETSSSMHNPDAKQHYPSHSAFAFTTTTQGVVSSDGNPEGNGVASSRLSRPRFFKVRRHLGSGTASRGRLDSNSNQFSSTPVGADQRTFGSTANSGSLNSGSYVGNSDYTSVGDGSSFDKGNFAFGGFRGAYGTDDGNVNARSNFEKTEQLNSVKRERVAGNAENLGSVDKVLGKEEHSAAEYKKLSSDDCKNGRIDDKPEMGKQTSSSFVFGSSQVHFSSKFNLGTTEFCEQFGNLSFSDKNTTSETQKVKATDPIVNSFLSENSSSSRHHDNDIFVFKGNTEGGNPFHQRGNEKENLNPANVTEASGTNSFTSAESAFVFKSGTKNSELRQGSMSSAMRDQSSNPNTKPCDVSGERNEVRKDDGNNFTFGCNSTMSVGSTQTVSSKQFEFQAGSSESLDSNCSSNHQTCDEFRVPNGVSPRSKTNFRNSGRRRVKLRQLTDKLLAEKHHKPEESNIEENFGSPSCSPMDFSPYQEARTDEYLGEQMKPSQSLNNNPAPSVSSGKVFHSFGGAGARLGNEDGDSKFSETCFGSEASVTSSKGEGVCSSARDAAAFPGTEVFTSNTEAQKFDSRTQYGFTSGPETFNEARFVFSASPSSQASSMRNKRYSKGKRVSSIKFPNYGGTSLPSDTTHSEEDGSAVLFTFKNVLSKENDAQENNGMKNLNLEREASSQYLSSSNSEKASQGSDATNATQKLSASENAASEDGNVFISQSQERFSSVQFKFSSGQEDISQRTFVFNGSLSGQHNSVQRKSRGKKCRAQRQTVTTTPCPVVEDGSSSTQFSFSSKGSVSSETMGCQQEDGSSVQKNEVKAYAGEEQMHSEQKVFPSEIQEACEKWRFRGNQAYKNGFFSRAERFYTKGIDSVPAHETSSCCKPLLLCYSNRAASRMSLGRIREAIDDCIMAVELDPNFLKVQMRAANCHLVLGEIDDAIGYFNKCLASGASICLDRRLLIEAADGLQRAKKVAEYVNLATTLLAEGSDVDRALEIISEAISISKFSEKLLEMKAEALYMLQKYEEVIQLCEQSLVVAEKNFLKSSVAPADFADGKGEGNSDVKLWRFLMMAKSHFSLGKLDEALDLLKKVDNAGSTTRSSKIIQSSLSLSTVISKLLQWKNMGNEAFRSKKCAEAVEHYTAALSCNIESRPFAAICFCNRAASYQALGQITDAIADCSLAISLNGSYTKAISRRASLHELIRDHGHAANDLRRLISILEDQQRSKASSGSSGTIDTINDLRKSQKRLSAAEEQAKKAIPLEFYLILGVKKSDTAADIKKAYRKAALRHHPDKAGQVLARSEIGTEGHHLWKAIGKEIHEDADRLFKIIGEAYAVLSDASKRAEYDMDEEIRAAPKESSSSSSFFSSSSPYRRYTSSDDYDSHYSYGRSNSSRRYWKESWKTHGNSESRW